MFLTRAVMPACQRRSSVRPWRSGRIDIWQRRDDVQVAGLVMNLSSMIVFQIDSIAFDPAKCDAPVSAGADRIAPDYETGISGSSPFGNAVKLTFELPLISLPGPHWECAS
jgi:hypothetical protein